MIEVNGMMCVWARGTPASVEAMTLCLDVVFLSSGTSLGKTVFEVARFFYEYTEVMG